MTEGMFSPYGKGKHDPAVLPLFISYSKKPVCPSSPRRRMESDASGDRAADPPRRLSRLTDTERDAMFLAW